MEDRRAGIHDQDSTQRPHEQRGDCAAIANKNSPGGLRQSEWPQLFEYSRELGERKKEAKRKRKKRRRSSPKQ
ncbi:hypothetical protein EUGRSUZ_L03051 [Eucalyptus grandis]|uniref:Uncharacterized protein n=1 Tax=Eucalyptus grandis TaxID=71139 RepID=A0AAD9T943_EUCGR|nr:hypothetical protein EUGRSUZ_L03051 [Eucalyptus grandis]